MVKPSTEAAVWLSDPPAKCELTGTPIGNAFVDGKTTMGPWACMSPEAHLLYGVGFGQGKGQLYTKQPDGRWLKTEG